MKGRTDVLTLSLLGHPYLSSDDRSLRLSQKAVALITLLVREGRPQHRERLANLLWNTPGALRNLRVELSRLNQRGLDLFPANQPMLELNLPTDLDSWISGAAAQPNDRLGEWLSGVSTLPLNGLDDLGSPEFQEWVQAQRAMVGEQIERNLSQVYDRALQLGLHGAAQTVRSQVRQLGLRIVPSTPATVPAAAHFERRETRARLQQILSSAEQRPQLVLLGGSSHAGHHDLIERCAEQTGWHVLQLEAAAHPDAQHAALLHHVLRIMLPGSPATPPAGDVRPPELTEDMIHVWTLIAQSRQRLLVAIHDVTHLSPSLLSSLHFAMNLRCSLALVLTGTALGGPVALSSSEGAFDLSRVHQLNLPPLSVKEIAETADRLRPPDTPDASLRRAAQIAQESEGWDLYAQTLIEQSPVPSLRVPDAVRAALVSSMDIPPRLRRALSQLAMVHGPLSPVTAELVVAPPYPDALLEGERRGLMVTAAAEETIYMPAAAYRPSDQDSGLTLISEAARVTLAGLLTSSERRQLRTVLAQHLLPTDPALALYYARGAKLPDLTRLALERLGPAAGAVPSTPPFTVVPPAEPPACATSKWPRVERRTGNAYRVALDDQQLEIMRRGQHSRPPLLRLRWEHVPAGTWRLTARLDVFQAAPELGVLAGQECFALAVRTSHSLELYLPAGAPFSSQERRPALRLPMHRWFQLTGHSDGGLLELQVRALDIALIIRDLSCGGSLLDRGPPWTAVPA
ncbi:hypothetical protein [Deinococcus sp. LM3]|uniref:hypothetical protein n=1 Tax=Deinococcus sp. LM3 TaxID=1938608 RepID=UPI0009919DDC|nr:hypothetical protein [Deinococcus sp. LM3]